MSTPPSEQMDAICRGLVREYLFRKGLTSALAAFDSETAPAPAISSSTALSHSLRLQSLIRKQQSAPPEFRYPSLLELLTFHYFKPPPEEFPKKGEESVEGDGERRKVILPSSSPPLAPAVSQRLHTSDGEGEKRSDGGERGEREVTPPLKPSPVSIMEEKRREAGVAEEKRAGLTLLSSKYPLPSSLPPPAPNPTSTTPPHESSSPPSTSAAAISTSSSAPPASVPSSSIAVNDGEVDDKSERKGSFWERLEAAKKKEGEEEGSGSGGESVSKPNSSTSTTSPAPLQPPAPPPPVPVPVPVPVPPPAPAPPAESPLVLKPKADEGGGGGSGDSFWARLEAAKKKKKAEEEEKSGGSGTIPPSSIPPHPTSIPSTTTTTTTTTTTSTSLPPPPPSTTTASSTSGGSGGDSFWARLEAAKKKKKEEEEKRGGGGAPPIPPHSTTTAAPTTTGSSSATTTTTTTTSGGGSGGGSFWERLEAAKKKKREEEEAKSGGGGDGASTASASASASASSSGGGSFWERLAAKKKKEEGGGGESGAMSYESRREEFLRRFTCAELGDGEKWVREEVGGQPLALRDCVGSEIVILDDSETVTADRLRNCRVFIAASCESVFLRECRDCVVYVACKQLRTRDCRDCTVSLYCKTEPIIETSARMHFMPFLGACKGIKAAWKRAMLDVSCDKWNKLFDFNKGQEVDGLVTHYDILPQSEWKEWAIGGEDAEQVRDPASLQSTPTSLPKPPPPTSPPHDEDGMMSFDIRTGQAAAEQMLRQLHETAEEGEDDEE